MCRWMPSVRHDLQRIDPFFSEEVIFHLLVAETTTPSRGRKVICALNGSSFGVGPGKLRRQLRTTLASTSTVSIQAKLSPMHMRDPTPKGKYAFRCRIAMASGRKRSGSKRIGSGYKRGSR